jgi:hypothetical protein
MPWSARACSTYSIRICDCIQFNEESLFLLSFVLQRAATLSWHKVISSKILQKTA